MNSKCHIFTVFSIFSQIVLTTIHLLQVQIYVYNVFDGTKVGDDFTIAFVAAILLCSVMCTVKVKFYQIIFDQDFDISNLQTFT